MKVTGRELRKIIREEVEAQGMDQERDLESRTVVIKGLTMAGLDPDKLASLPSSKRQLNALLDMIEQAIDTTLAGKAIAAEKKMTMSTRDLTK